MSLNKYGFQMQHSAEQGYDPTPQPEPDENAFYFEGSREKGVLLFTA